MCYNSDTKNKSNTVNIMATFKACALSHQRKADGTYNIKIRITQGRQRKYIATEWYVTAKELDLPQGGPVPSVINIKSKKYIEMAWRQIIKYREMLDPINTEAWTVGQVYDFIKSGGKGPADWDLDIIDYWRDDIARLEREGHAGTAETRKTALNNFIKVFRRARMSVMEITPSLLNKWVAAITGKRAPSLYLTQLRAVHNRAKLEFNDEDANIIRIPGSPFKHIEFPKMPIVEKRSITVEQLRAIAALPDSHNRTPNHTNRRDMARDVFILSFLLCGMNAADLYECPPIVDGRITYNRKKTRTRRRDRALISIEVPPEALPIIARWAAKPGKGLAFRFADIYATVGNFRHAIGSGLQAVQHDAGIDGQTLQYYAARHTWATIAANDVGLDIHTVGEALNHVDDATAVTSLYIRKDWRRIDRANRAVLDFANLPGKPENTP